MIAAARTLRTSDRLFALTVDEDGRAELVAWAAGGPVPVRSFRVDLVGAEAARVEGETPTPAPSVRGEWRPWVGDVEPVPFPFRPGLVAEPVGFGFDARGEWAVVIGKDGTPHAVPLGGGPPEVLPRPFAGGVVQKQVDAVLGVNGGVVLCGRMLLPGDPTTSVTILSPGPPVGSAGASEYEVPGRPAELFVAAHYDFAARRVTLHRLGPASGGARWSAYPELYCVAVRVASDVPGPTGCALDLATLHRFPGPASGSLQARAMEAWRLVGKGGSPPFELAVYDPQHQFVTPAGADRLALFGLAIHPIGAFGEWQQFRPTRDGKPLLDGATVERAVLAGSVLCLRVSRGKDRRLLLFRGPEGTGLGEVGDQPADGPFALSADGRWLARRRGRREVVISETADLSATPVVATTAGLHHNLTIEFHVRPFELRVGIGDRVHVFGLDDDGLSYRQGGDTPNVAGPRPTSSFAPVDYDTDRFPFYWARRAGRLTAVADRLGQLLVYGDGPEPVAAFLVRRDRAAAWANGAFWGDASLIGGPPTPGAARTIGEAIRSAGG